jgi:hypothetical protein
MTKEIFVGGYTGSGTRAIQFLLREAGYFGGERIAAEHDYMPTNPDIGKEYLSGKDVSKKFKKLVERGVIKDGPFSIKHGFFMLMLPAIRRAFPDSKFIMMVRHGIDNILNHHRMDEDFGEYIISDKMDLPLLERRAEFWAEAHRTALKDVMEWEDNFMLVKLEDLVSNPREKVRDILNFVGVAPRELSRFTRLIKQPSTIGRYKYPSVVENAAYFPEFAHSYYERAKDVMDLFGYKYD